MTFAIYAQPEGQAEPLWSEIHPAVPGVAIRNGQINVLLGQITSLDDPGGSKPAVTFDQAPRYLGITIGNGSGAQEMIPRHQLVPAFHARTAEVASTVVLNGVDANAIRPNAVTENKLGTDAVTTNKIKDGSVGTVDLALKAVTNDQIDDGTITAAKLAPGVVPAVSPPLFVLQAIVLGPSVTVPYQAQASQLENGGLSIKNALAGQAITSLAIPCSAGPSVGVDCSANPEVVGIVFDPPRSGMYEVCVDAGVFMQNRQLSAETAWELKLVYTQNGSPAVIQDNNFAVERLMALAYAAKADEVHQRNIPMRSCELFQLAGGVGSKATIRLFGRARGVTGPLGNGPVELTHSESSNKGLVRFTVREIR